jgi:hypothetical protein
VPTVIYLPVGEIRSLLTPMELLSTGHTVDARVWAENKGEVFFILTNPAKQREWMFFNRDYADFQLRLEFQLTRGANSGVALRNKQGQKILEVQIADDSSLPEKTEPFEFTGSLYGVKLDHRAELKPLGQWNAMEIDLKGSALKVKVNGTETLAIALDDPAVTKFLGVPAEATGLLGLQAWIGSVHFRNVQIREYMRVKR